MTRHLASVQCFEKDMSFSCTVRGLRANICKWKRKTFLALAALSSLFKFKFKFKFNSSTTATPVTITEELSGLLTA